MNKKFNPLLSKRMWSLFFPEIYFLLKPVFTGEKEIDYPLMIVLSLIWTFIIAFSFILSPKTFRRLLIKTEEFLEDEIEDAKKNNTEVPKAIIEAEKILEKANKILADDSNEKDLEDVNDTDKKDTLDTS